MNWLQLILKWTVIYMGAISLLLILCTAFLLASHWLMEFLDRGSQEESSHD